MSMHAQDFQSDAALIGRKYFHFGMTQSQIANFYASLASAVTADAAVIRDVTLQRPGTGLTPGTFQHNLSRELLLLVNKGRRDVGPATMGSILQGLANANLFPPTNTALPVIDASAGLGVGAQLIRQSPGTWTGSPTGFTNQWRRGATNIGGATGNGYTIVVADVGSMISLAVTAMNADGSATAISAPVGPITALGG